MKTYIEIWNPKPSWMALSQAERSEYLGQIGPSIQTFAEQGVGIVSWGLNDSAGNHEAGYKYFAIWSFPTDELIQEFEALVTAAGWYDFFDQVNLCGVSGAPDAVIGDMIGL